MEGKMTNTSEERMRERASAIAPIFEYLDGHGIKRTWLAGQLGLSAGRLCMIESGRRPAPDRFMAQSCRVLGINSRRLRQANAA
jgi:hypothetical protein